ncbi:MAG: right-handed parallel beta-helix repeat-containing protein, partial [Defluviitaleaceae bacterium]|nr:right-handed parallel beta-helix repeat-containing protein [Defluviitaleaceae bacterium]
GGGPDTVLYKPACVSSSLTMSTGYGHYDVPVEDPGIFCVGDGLLIMNQGQYGFHTTVATITDIIGENLVIDRMLNNDYSHYHKARATTVYPLVSGVGIKDAGVGSMRLEGNAKENILMDGCRGAGIYFICARDVTVCDMEVRDYNGEGIGWQQCVNVVVDRCVCDGITGAGYHLGSGTVGMVVRDSVGKNCRDGLFFCFRATRALLDNFTASNNKEHGINIGYRDTDIEIRNGSIENNGTSGIVFRKNDMKLTGNRTLIRGNKFAGNPVGVLLESDTDDVYLVDNEGLCEGCVKAADEKYLKAVSFKPPINGLTFHERHLQNEELYHLGLRE